MATRATSAAQPRYSSTCKPAFQSLTYIMPSVATYASQVYLVHPDGSGLHAVTQGPWSHAQPAWSRDGRSLLVYRSWETADSESGVVAHVPLPASD